MRRRRMGRPGIAGTMARTAVVAGTATAVAGGVSRRQAGRAQAHEQEAAAQQAAFETQADMADMQAQMNAMQAQQAATGRRSGRQRHDEPAAAAGRHEGERSAHR